MTKKQLEEYVGRLECTIANYEERHREMYKSIKDYLCTSPASPQTIEEGIALLNNRVLDLSGNIRDIRMENDDLHKDIEFLNNEIQRIKAQGYDHLVKLRELNNE